MDLLYAIRDKYIITAMEYGMTETEAQDCFEAMFARMANTVIDGATYNFDYNQLLSLRRQLAKLYETLLQGELVTYSITGTTAKVTVLSQTENITVDGEIIGRVSKAVIEKMPKIS